MEKQTQLSNPSKFGLAGFSIALLMLGFAYADVIALNNVVLATILTMGVVAPLIAGVLEFVKGNSYRSTAFILYGLFFLTFYIFHTRTLNAAPINRATLGIFFIAWALVTAALLCGIILKRMGPKNITLTVILANALAFLTALAVAEFAQVRAIFIVAGVFALMTALAILVDFFMHIMYRIKRDAAK